MQSAADTARCVHANGRLEEGGPVAFNNSGERIEHQQPSPLRRHKIRRVDDRRGIHPQLDEKWQRVANVAVLHVEARGPGADGERKDHGQPDQRHEHERGDTQTEAVPDHHDDQNRPGDRKIDQARSDRGSRNHHPRKIHLGDDGGVAQHAVAADGYGVGEERPWKQSRVRENRIRNSVRWHLGQPAEDKREHQHREQRLKNRPGGAEQSLLVADLHVTPDQEIEEIAVAPEVEEVQPDPSPAGDDRNERLRVVGDGGRRLRRFRRRHFIGQRCRQFQILSSFDETAGAAAGSTPSTIATISCDIASHVRIRN